MTLAMFSGCNKQGATTNNSDGLGRGSIGTIFVGSKGGHFSVLQGYVEVNVSSGSVSTQTDITVQSIQNPVQDTSLNILSCYEFGPDGQTFNKPIEVIIHYDIDDLPNGMKEADLRVYFLNDDIWEPIEGSFANQSLHYAVAQVSHFSKMGCGGSAASSGSVGDDSSSGDNGGEGSSQIWFKADLYFYDHKTLRLHDKVDRDTYSAGVSAYWKPVSYAQYYQIKFVFNGNPPKEYSWGCEYRDQSERYCPKSPYPRKEGYVYQLGGDPNLEGFITLYDSTEVATASKYNQETGKMEYFEYGRLRPSGTHGFSFFGVYDTVEDVEKLSDLEKDSLVANMQAYVHNSVSGWEIWVRGITERGD
jgi:hypothetical protein